MREVSRSNLASYLCWNTHMGNSDWTLCWSSSGQQVSHQRWILENVHHMCLHRVWLRLPTLALKSRDVTWSPKQGYQWPHKRACVRQNLKKKTDLASSLQSTARNKSVEAIVVSSTLRPQTVQIYFCFSIGGSRGGREGRTPPLGVQILSISCSFRENLACSRPPWRVHAPPSGKSWIRHCFPLVFIHVQRPSRFNKKKDVKTCKNIIMTFVISFKKQFTWNISIWCTMGFYG